MAELETTEEEESIYADTGRTENRGSPKPAMETESCRAKEAQNKTIGGEEDQSGGGKCKPGSFIKRKNLRENRRPIVCRAIRNSEKSTRGKVSGNRRESGAAVKSKSV